MSWKRTTLGEVADIVSGTTPKSDNSTYWDGPIAWATPTDLSRLSGKHIGTTERTISEAGLNSCSVRVLPPHSVLFSSRAPIGLVAINTTPMATNQGFKSFVPKPELNADFLFWWLKSNRRQLEDLGNGATFKEVSKAVISRVPFFLPPVHEQRRIASILDRADSVRRKNEQALALSDHFVQSVFLEMFGKQALPTKPLSEVVALGTIVTYGIVQAGPEIDGGVPYIRTGDIKNGKIQLDGLRHTSHEIASRFERSAVRQGEIVMSIRATVGTTAVVPRELNGANLTQGTARISPGSSVTLEYLLSYLRSSAAQYWIQNQVKGATFREITLKRLRELPVPLPDMDGQRRYSAIYKNCDGLSSRMSVDLRDSEELLAGLSQRAFRGEL